MNPIFNKDTFAELLNKAKGDNRSLNSFASDAGVSPAYISRLIRKLVETAPSPDIISKIADNSHNDEVSYNKLMQAAGHLRLTPEEKKLENASEYDDKLFHITVIKRLLGDEKLAKISFDDKFFDLIADFNGGDINKWRFIFRDNISLDELHTIYGKLAAEECIDNAKFTIAVSEAKSFDMLRENAPKSLKMNISAMLLDTGAKLIKEAEMSQGG